MTADDARAVIRESIGSQPGANKRWAAKLNMGSNHLSDVLCGRQAPGIVLLRSVGLRRVMVRDGFKIVSITYERIDA